MHFVPRSAKQRIVLRRMSRAVRREDPQLARLLSGRAPGALPALRFTTVPFAGYLTIGVLLFATGVLLGVGSVVLWGLACLGLAVLRRRIRTESGRAPVPGTPRHGRDADRYRP
ncbi:MAG TPA: DUF3040 domain-containing protein [Kineosporiaceae bacterium]